MTEHQKEQHKKEEEVSSTTVWLIAIAAVLILFNQIQLFQLGNMMGTSIMSFGGLSSSISLSSGDLKNVDVNTIKSSAQSVAAVYKLDGKDAQGVIDTMIPKGQPEYGKDLGISYDDPVTALNFLAKKLYPAIKQDVEKNKPEVWARYIALATKPVGISCEFCCGVGPVDIDKTGKLLCGCAHSPAIQAVVLHLMANTDMSDAEILREVVRWKALWFPKDMVKIGVQLAGGDTSILKDVPSQVGGC